MGEGKWLGGSQYRVEGGLRVVFTRVCLRLCSAFYGDEEETIELGSGPQPVSSLLHFRLIQWDSPCGVF